MGNQAKTTPAHDNKVDRGRTVDSTTQKTGGGSSSLLLAFGTLVLLAAAFVELSPRYLPAYAWVQHAAARRGLTTGILGLAGILTFAMGLSSRAVRTPKSNGKDEVDRGLVLDQLAVDLAQMRGGMQELRVDFVYLKDTNQSILTAIRDGGAGGATRDQQDAMFRLAASLDQVGERLDQRIQMQQSMTQQSLTTMHDSITSLQKQMSDLASTSSRLASAQNGTMSGSSWSAGTTSARSRSKSGEVDVWVELEEGDDTNLGLLDTLDEYGQMPESRTSLKMDSQFPGDSRSRPAISDQDMPQGPLPNRRGNSTHSGMAHDTGATGTRGDESMASMIDNLKTLLSDARVRQALESLGQRTREPS